MPYGERKFRGTTNLARQIYSWCFTRRIRTKNQEKQITRIIKKFFLRPHNWLSDLIESPTIQVVCIVQIFVWTSKADKKWTKEHKNVGRKISTEESKKVWKTQGSLSPWSEIKSYIFCMSHSKHCVTLLIQSFHLFIWKFVQLFITRLSIYTFAEIFPSLPLSTKKHLPIFPGDMNIEETSLPPQRDSCLPFVESGKPLASLEYQFTSPNDDNAMYRPHMDCVKLIQGERIELSEDCPRFN